MSRLLRFLFQPFIRYSDNRMRELHQRLDLLSHQVDERVQELLKQVGERSRSLEEEFLEFKSIVVSDLTKRMIDLDPALADYGAHAMVGHALDQLGSGTAELLNWASGHLGFGAQAGLWFNHPVSVEYGEKTVAVGEVNERIAETSFALAAGGKLPPNSRVLDVGCAESTLALSLASIGLEVFALDPRPYPLTHPRMTVISVPLQEWGGPAEPLDAIFCVSTLEHIGTRAYGQDPAETENIDRAILGRFRPWLAPGGELVLTLPYGLWSADDFQRVYDPEHLDALLDGWQIIDRKVCARANRLHWELLEEEPPLDFWHQHRGVVLIRATPRQQSRSPSS